MAQTLENRITSALRDASRLTDVQSVIAEVEAETTRMQDMHASEVARSIDPSLTTPAAREARNNAADYEHDVRRLRASHELLSKRRQAILDDESYAQRVQRYDAAVKERDDLAAVIRDRYPQIAMEILDIVIRIKASDATCSAVNQDRPRGRPALESAEALARGVPSNFYSAGGPITKLEKARLPFLDQPGGYLPVQASNITQNSDSWHAAIAQQRQALGQSNIQEAANA